MNEENKKPYLKGGKKTKMSPPPLKGSREDSQFYLDWAEWMWTRYVSGGCVFGWNGSGSNREDSFSLLRAYAKGKQPVEKYQTILDASKGRNGKARRLMNISWRPPNHLVKLVDIVMGKAKRLEFEIGTVANDEGASAEKSKLASKLKMQTDPRMKALRQKIGRPQKKTPGLPFDATPEAIEIFEQMGGLRLQVEIEMQDAFSLTRHYSRWDDELKDRIYYDCITLGRAACKHYLEKSSGIIKSRYVDPQNLLYPKDGSLNQEYATWGGEVREVTLSELRRESNLPEKDLYLLAKKRGNSTFESALANWTNKDVRDDYYSQNGSHVYDDLKVEILDFCFVAKEAETEVIAPTGAMEPGAKELSGKEENTELVEYVYEAKWVIGTKLIFDNDHQYGIARKGGKGSKTAIIPYSIWIGKSPSLVKRCIPYVDDISIATFKKRALIAKLPPAPRLGIDLSKVQPTTTLKGRKVNILESFETFTIDGIFTYESVNEWSRAYEASNGKPIEPIVIDFVNDLMALNQEIVTGVQEMRDQTGVNEVADGTADPNMLVGLAKGMDAATNNALTPMLAGYESIYNSSGRYWAIAWPVALLKGEIRTSFMQKGGKGSKSVFVSEQIRAYSFDVQTKIRPSEEDRQAILEDIRLRKEQDALPISDYFSLLRLVREGKLEKAQLILAIAVNKYAAEKHRKELEKIQANGEASRQAAEATAEGKKAEFQAKAEAEVWKEGQLSEIRKDEERLKHQHKLEQIEAEGGIKIDAEERSRQQETA